MILLLGCTPPDVGPAVTDTSLTPSEAVPTVATLTWETSDAARTHVRFGSAVRTYTTPLEADAATDHRATLVGVPANTDATWEILDADETVLASGAWTTGALATELPSLTVSGEGNDQFVVTSILGATTAAVVLSPDGDIVWWHLTDPTLDTYRARPARNGCGVAYNAASISGDPSEDSRIEMVTWDGAGTQTHPVPLLAHDWVERDDGTLALMQVRYGGDDGTLRGDAIVEARPDGTLADVWTSWDCFDPAVTPGDEPTLGWTFANALDYDAATDRYLLGLRNFSSLAWIDRATGACEQILGGDLSDFAIDGDRFRHQHQFHAFDADDGPHVLVFDNDGTGGSTSRAIEYALDGGVAREVWSYTPDPPVYNFVLGDVQRLDDGDTFVAFSVAGQLDRVRPDGARTWSVNTDVGYAFGFTTLVPALDTDCRPDPE